MIWTEAVAAACRKWKTRLECIDQTVRLVVDGYYPEKEIRTAETSAAVPHVAAVPQVRKWMKLKQRECIQFGSLVMEGREPRDPHAAPRRDGLAARPRSRSDR